MLGEMHRDGRRRWWLLAALALSVLACSLAIPISALLRGVVHVGSVTVPAGREQTRPLLVLGGPVRIEGVSTAPVIVIRGRIEVAGDARDDLIAAMGDITLGAGSATRADVVALGGRVERSASAAVLGSVFSGALPAQPAGAGGSSVAAFVVARLRLAGLAITALLLLGLAVWAVLPWPALVTTAMARRFRWLSVALGLGTLLCAPLIVVPLAVSLAGLPLAVLLTLGLGVLWLIGVISSAVRLGHRLLSLSGKPHSLLSATLVGLVCLGLLPAVPVAGPIALVLAGCVGLGGALVAVWDRDVAGDLAVTQALSGFRFSD